MVSPAGGVGRTMRWLAWTIVFFVLLTVSSLAFIQTRMGKDMLASWVSRALESGLGTPVHIEGVHGIIPFDFSVDRAIMGEAAAPWFRVEGFSFQWFPEALLKRTIHIGRLEAAAVEILGLPPGDASKSEPRPSRRQWPVSIPPVLLEHFSIGRLFADASVLGEEAEFNASGRMLVTAGGESVHGDFSVLRLDAPGERAGLSWVLDTSPSHLALDLELVTPETGIISSLSGVHPGATSLRLSGKGPPADWRGEMNLEAGEWGAVRCDIRADGSLDRLSFETEGVFEIREHLIEEAVSLSPGIGSGAFSLSASVSKDRTASIRRFVLTLDGIQTELSGVIDMAGRTGEIRLDLSIPEIARFSSPVLPVLSGRAHSSLDLRGGFEAPHADLNIEVSGLRAEGVELGSATGLFIFRPDEGGGLVFPEGLHVRGKGAFRDLSLAAGDGHLDVKNLDWDFDSLLDSLETLSVSNLGVSDGNLEAEFTGLIQLASRSLEGRLRMGVHSLAHLPFIGETGVKGNGSFTALVNADAFSRSVRADVEGRLQGLGPVPDELKTMALEGFQFGGSVALKDGSVFHVSDFRSVFSGFEFTMDGRADLAGDKVDISLLGAVPDAGVFSSPAGRTIGGTVLIDAGVSGPLDNPKADVEVAIQDFRLDEVRVGDVRATLHGQGIPSAPEGWMTLSVFKDNLELSAHSHVRVDTPFIELSDMRLEGAGAQLSGELTVHVPSGTARGSLNGKAESLAPVSALLGRNLEGAAEMVLRLHGVDDVQNIDLDLSVNHLKSFSGRARKIEISAKALDVLGEMSGSVSVGVTDYSYGEVSLERFSLEAGGTAGIVAFDMNGSGVFKEPFNLSSTGVVRWPEDMALLDLESFDAGFGPHVVVLAAPAEIHLLTGGGVVITPIVLHSDSGRFEIKGGMAEKLDLAADFEEIPLALLAMIGGPPLEGSARGGVRLSGTSRKPGAEIEMVAEDVGFPGAAFRHLPRINISSNASLVDGRIEARLIVDEEESRSMEAFLAAPANVSLSPFTAAFPEHGDIEGRLQADLDLKPLPLWLSVDGLHLSGMLKADVSLSGSPSTPVMSGEVRVREGSCEVLQSGSVFRNVDALVRVRGDDLILEHLRATDGNEGTIEMEGRLRPLPGEGFPFTGRLGMQGFRLVRLDEVTAVTGAELRLSGTSAKAEISGSVTVVSAEARIPDRLPPTIHELDVVEVNGSPDPLQTAAPGPEEVDAGMSGLMVADLDIHIDIPGRTYVRGLGLESEWRGMLHVGGTAKDPEIRGDLSIVRGHYDFIGERFSLSSGNVILDGSSPPDPLMNVTAERRKAGMTGRVILSGRPSALDVEVTSDPPMPRDEVMARLLFGRSLTTITPMQALKLARALDVLSGGKTFGFLDRAQRAIGFDQFELVQSDDPEGSTALSVGRYLSDDAYVSVEKGLGTDEGRITLEYELTPRISVQTEVGADSTGGVELKWKWDY